MPALTLGQEGSRQCQDSGKPALWSHIGATQTIWVFSQDRAGSACREVVFSEKAVRVKI